MMKKCIRAGRVTWTSLLSAGVVLGAGWQASAGQSVDIAWNASDSTDIASYNIYYWQSGATVTNKLAVGDVTAATVSGLMDGATYYFYITASDGAGLESTPSGQISYTVPVPVVLQLQPLPQGGGAAAWFITATGDVPAQWALECSTNLQDWAVYANGTNTAVNIQVSTTTAPRSFFRLRSL